MPTSLKDIPKSTYHLGLPDTVLNVKALLDGSTEEDKTLQSIAFNHDQTTEISYFLTDTIVNGKIIHSHFLSPGLISKGAFLLHVIK